MAVYDRHDVANLNPGDITVGALTHESAEQDDSNWSNDFLVNHAVELMIRVHTGYEGDIIDRVATTLLTDQVVEELKTHINLVNYRLMDFEVTSFGAVFAESATTGGEISIILHRLRLYPQA